jgi:hypothetical protein
LLSNQLTGAIPGLAEAPLLEELQLSNNQLTGSVPDVSVVPKLTLLLLANNQLSGVMPSLSTNAALTNVRLDNNQLSGPLPSLAGLAQLEVFTAPINQFTGNIPALSNVPKLREYSVTANQLNGVIPPLEQLPSLEIFRASLNQLNGSIPSLSSLLNLKTLDVSGNSLTGSLPTFSGNPLLSLVRVANNQLSGALPAAPLTLQPGGSNLCPNQFTPTADPAWNTATGVTPWSSGCVAAKLSQSLAFDFPAPTLAAGGVGIVSATGSPSAGPTAPIAYSSQTPSVCTVMPASGVVSVSPTAALGDYCIIAADRAGDAAYNTAAQVKLSIPITVSVNANTCRIDVNGDGFLHAEIDGVLLLRYLFGFRDTSLTAGLFFTGLRPTATQIVPFLDAQNFDVMDGFPPATPRATRDGHVIMRFLRGANAQHMLAGTDIDPDEAGTVMFIVKGWCGL